MDEKLTEVHCQADYDVGCFGSKPESNPWPILAENVGEMVTNQTLRMTVFPWDGHITSS